MDSYNLVQQVLGAESILKSVELYARFKDELENFCFVFFGETGTSLPSYFNKTINGMSILGLTAHDKMFILDKERYDDFKRGKSSIYRLDTCLELDTQIMRYLRNLFSRKDSEECKKCEAMLSYILKNNIDYGNFIYTFENSIKFDDEETRVWAYDNLLYYCIFKEADLDAFKTNLLDETPKARHYIEADNMLTVISKFSKAEEAKGFYRFQMQAYCLLLKAIFLKRGSKKGIKFKVEQLLEYCNEEFGLFMERELAICYMFLKDEKRVEKFFEKTQINSKNILKTIYGMSWDLCHLRMLEYLTSVKMIEECPVSLHALVTFDQGLQDVIKAYPVKGLAFSKKDMVCIFETPLQNLITEVNIEESFFVNKEKRREVFSKVDYEKLARRGEKDINALPNIKQSESPLRRQ